MGMFDDVIDVPPIKCDCGAEVTGWQSKDLRCNMDQVPFWKVRNFYADCRQCWTWHQYVLRAPPQPRPITDYELISTKSDAPMRPVLKDGKWVKP